MSDHASYTYEARNDLLYSRAKLYPDRTTEDISERFSNAGTSARLCLEYSPSEIKTFYHEREALITFDTVKRFIDMLLDEKLKLRIDDISHWLCVIRRSDLDSSKYIVEPMSAFVRDRLLTQLWNWKEEDRISMIERLRRIPGAGGILEVLFESHFQHRFSTKIDIVATPMFRTSDSRSRWQNLARCVWRLFGISQVVGS